MRISSIIILTATIYKIINQYGIVSQIPCLHFCDPEDVSVYMGHSLINTTNRIILLFIVLSLLHRHLPII